MKYGSQNYFFAPIRKTFSLRLLLNPGDKTKLRLWQILFLCLLLFFVSNKRHQCFFCDWEFIWRSRRIGLKSTTNSTTHCIDLRPKSMIDKPWGDKRRVMAGISGWFKAHFKWTDMPRDPWSSWFNTSEGFKGVPKSPTNSTLKEPKN